MSRGLSQQQRQILGIATHVNRLTQDGTLAVKTGAPVPSYPQPSVDYRGVKDLQWPLAAHLLSGLPFVAADSTIEKTNGVVQGAGAFFDLRVPAAKSDKASTLRAITSLVRTGHLCCAPQDEPVRWGYVLTEGGLALGQQYEAPFAPALVFRACLIVFPHQYPYIWLFYPLYARLCGGAITLADVITAFAALTPRPVADGPTHYGTPAYEQRVQWNCLRNQEVRAITLALLGEEGLKVFPPNYFDWRPPAL
jgi:hypothetical protein